MKINELYPDVITEDLNSLFSDLFDPEGTTTNDSTDLYDKYHTIV